MDAQNALAKFSRDWTFGGRERGKGPWKRAAGDEHRGFEDVEGGPPVPPPLGESSFPAAIRLDKLDGENGFRLDGIDANDGSGLSVASAGDVNGDGFGDIIVGAFGADPNGDSYAGESYVVFGKAGGFGASLDLASLDGANGFLINGIDAYDESGRSVASAGDVNGDGFGDIIIGAHYAGINGDSSAGESYVVFGKAGGFAASLDLASLNGANGFRLEGIDAYDSSGRSVASAGDVNGDGFGDVIVGARGGDPNGDLFAGESYVVFGKADGFAASLDLGGLNGADGFRIDGTDTYDFSGRSVASAADVNGDGFGDLIVGAHGGDPNGDGSAGESYVVFGKAGGFGASLDLASLDGANGFRIDGIDPVDQSGYSVASAGDVNGDGFGDIIVGAEGGGDLSAGESYVVFGKAGGFAASLDLAALDGDNGFRIDGADYGDYSGFSVASAGDVNGDGFGDVIVGAHGADPNGDYDAGRSYVVFGKAGGFAASIDLAALDGANGFRIDGIDVNDFSGRSVASAGDVNGDGFGDIIIGANGGDPNGDTFAGESYVVFGRAPDEAVNRIGSAADQTIRGGDFADTLSGLGGKDTLVGAGGRDVLNGGSGGDLLDGGGGSDSADYSNAAAKVRANLQSPGGNTGAAAGDSYVSIENLRGSSFFDKLSGDDSANRIEGLAKGDALIGRGGRDTLAGGAGRDTLKGGEGNDRFELASLDADDADKILDFTPGGDKVALDGDVFGLNRVKPSAFVVGSAAGDAGDRLIYDDATGKLFFDPDGTGAQAKVLIAAFTGAPTLGAADFVVI